MDSAAVRALAELVGGDREVLAELVEDFLQEAPQRLAEMRSGDIALAGRAAHTLKSNALTFGAPELAAVCREVERSAREGAIASEMLDGADDAWSRVLPELNGLR